MPRWPLVRFVLPLVLLTWAAEWTPARAENWPSWRGPRANGISAETGLPAKFGPGENILWRLPLRGPGGATPVIWDQHIFLTAAVEGDLYLIAASTDGKLLWEKKIATGDEAVRVDEGNYASPSPVTDGKYVWAMFGTGDLVCYDFAGREVWKLNLQDRYGRFDIQFGMTSTPVLDRGRLYLQLLHSQAALVVCLDAATGEQVWSHERQSDATAECEHSYASPVLYREGDHELLLTHGCDYIVAHALSDGHELWRAGGMNPKSKYNPTLRLVASPAANEGLIVVPTAKNGPILGLLPNGQGDVTGNTRWQVWRREDSTPDVPSPLILDGLVYLCREDGRLLVLDAKTGAEQYYTRTHSQRHRASPVYADGKIYLTARDGVVTVVKPGRTYEVLASNELGEPISASPAVANGRMYFRSFEALYAIGTK